MQSIFFLWDFRCSWQWPWRWLYSGMLCCSFPEHSHLLTISLFFHLRLRIQSLHRTPTYDNRVFGNCFSRPHLPSLVFIIYLQLPHELIGTGMLQVKGVSISSPYRLRPLVGVRVPLNSTYCPLIHMHNPHATSLQVSKHMSTLRWEQCGM
jgi:hypothetical protein